MYAQKGEVVQRRQSRLGIWKFKSRLTNPQMRATAGKDATLKFEVVSAPPHYDHHLPTPRNEL